MLVVGDGLVGSTVLAVPELLAEADCDAYSRAREKKEERFARTRRREKKGKGDGVERMHQAAS